MDPKSSIPSKKNPSKPLPTSALLHYPFLFTISLLFTAATPYPQTAEYSQHCNHIVPQTPLDPTTSSTSSFRDPTSLSLRISTSFFSGDGANKILNTTLSSDSQFHLTLFPYYTHKSLVNGIYKIKARLIFGGTFWDSRNRNLRMVQLRGPRFPVGRSVVTFGLSGFWSESTGNLCMVGSGSGNSMSFDNVLLKLHYSKSDTFSVFGSLVTGVLESLDDKTSSSYFKPVSILGIAQFDEKYEFSLMKKGDEVECLSQYDGGESLSLKNSGYGICSVLRGNIDRFDLDYGSDCGNVSCNVISNGGGRDLPHSMLIKRLRCVDKQKIQMLLGFRNMSLTGGSFPFDPNTTLIAEGAWDEEKNQLCAVACRVMNFTESLSNAFVGNCSIKLSLRFPAVLSLENQSMVVGQIWSNETIIERSYFNKVGFQSSQGVIIPGLKYKYTFNENVRTSCPELNTVKHKGKTYPAADSLDMKFDMSVRNRKGQVAQGSASPVFVGDQLYPPHNARPLVPMVRPNGSAVQLSNSHSRQQNVSYQLLFMPSPDFMFGSAMTKEVEIAAEGIYDKDTGVLCMIGCRHLATNYQNTTKHYSHDCDIEVTIQFSPMNAKGTDHPIKGTIKSTRKKSDPLYFERLALSSNSIYTNQAAAYIWRMDLEITMVLVSNTLGCVFVGLQLFHMKKNPNVLPWISLLMLVLLTLGYMIPLLLNFEAMFKGDHSQQSVLLGSGGWLEVNEIIVRVVTMVAFLLQFCLLQLTWSARKGDDRQKGLWISEKKVLYVALPLYMCGGLIYWIIHQFDTSHQRPFLRPRRQGYMVFRKKPHIYQHSFWGDLRSYGGLVLDGFLLPQILLNVFCNSKEQALSASFYLGTTLVRLLPHAYDLYRAHSSAWYLDMSYIYANHRMDLYSTAWDIIIPCGGLLFAVLIFLQQRLGGCCILPKRFGVSSIYEEVPIVSSEELQGESVHKNLYTL
ncbi:DUF2921 domain-containing protein [Cephalotus follicularis]|uniref:RING-type E3 ubiquitin transferase n=1 Tax=Cephalotus follicularis TaxID=3775 RepID=A0A1Q3D806_CEPFO|nr:DUF2921 domain-containing protein [Cephalotus follicularis]